MKLENTKKMQFGEQTFVIQMHMQNLSRKEQTRNFLQKKLFTNTCLPAKLIKKLFIIIHTMNILNVITLEIQ